MKTQHNPFNLMPLCIGLLLLFSCSSVEDVIEKINDKFKNNFIVRSQDAYKAYSDGISIENGILRITQYGITWHIKRSNGISYTISDNDYGQFVNGDYWVVGPVKIISIDPKSTEILGRTKNGSMVNPIPSRYHGYDSACDGHTYLANLNAGLGLSKTTPLELQNKTSLISSISIDNPGNNPQLKTAAILTVLTVNPPIGTFRPAYAGTIKTLYNTSNINYSYLGNVAPIGTPPSFTIVERYLERPWIDHVSGWLARAIHPQDNMPNYGQDMTFNMSRAALLLNCNYSNAQKETLLIKLIQLGIDNYGILQAGGREIWAPDGGHCQGRKFPILFAGVILNNTEMKNIGQKSGDYLYTYNYPTYGPGNVPPDYIFFQEDCQTFFVTAADVSLASTVTNYNGITFYGHYYPPYEVDYSEYTSTDIGLPEWGIWHSYEPLGDGKDWDAAYRTSNTAISWTGFILAARIMNLQTLWNHNSLFEYMDRYMAITALPISIPSWRYNTYSSYSGNTQFIQDVWGTNPDWHPGGFEADMWDYYRDSF